MNRAKWMIFCGFLFLLIVTVFKDYLYRKSINYTEFETRKSIILTNPDLINEIDLLTTGKALNIETIIRLSNHLTSSKLKFTFKKTSSNPNEILKTASANCVGYARLFNAIGNHILEKQGLADTYEFRHIVGRLDFFGFDIHKLVNDPFFKNHDYNQVKDKLTGNEQFVDPSLRDYFGIEVVNSHKNIDSSW